MNLIVIGENTDKICMDIWKNNTNYTIINQNPYIFNKQFLKYIENRSVIISTNAQQFMPKDINDVVDYFKTHNFIPLFVANDTKSVENNMYTAISALIPETVLYMRNKNNENYDEFVKIGGDYILGKGLLKNDENKSVRTPKKRKRTTPKK